MRLIAMALLLAFPVRLILPFAVACTAIGPPVPKLMPSLLIDGPRPVPLKAISPFFDPTVPELRYIPELAPVPALPVPVNVTFPSAVWIVGEIGGTGVGVGGAGTLST